MDAKELETRFTYHSPVGDQPQKYASIRNHAKQFAEAIDLRVPESREKSLALTKLEEVVFWANAAIARRDGPVA